MGFCVNFCTSSARLDGVTAVVTGSNNGIGKIAAQEFYKRGARVLMACRNLTKAQEAVDDIKKHCAEEKLEGNLGELVIKELDLQSLTSVRRLAEDILNTEPKIQLLINNAGIMACPLGKTEDGFETQFATNHLGHFLLTILLLPKIIASAPARIVTVSSLLHKGPKIKFDDLNYEHRSYSPHGAYQQSKLANVLFSRELAKRLQNTGVNTYVLHPGVVKTNLQADMDNTLFPGANFLLRTLGSPFWKTPFEGAQTTIHCAISEEAANETGLYYANCKVETPSSNARDVEAAKQLWEVSLQLVGVSPDPYPAASTEVFKST